MKNQLTMIAFVIIMGIISAAILVGTDNFTKQTILDNEELALKSTILNAFGIEYTKDTVLDVYAQSITSEEKNGTMYYYTKDGIVGYRFEGKGLWGPIRGFITLAPDHVTINGIQIIYHEETPGLGGVVSEQWYLDKFKGKLFDPSIVISKEADPAANNEVDAITGATLTSNSFQTMLNQSYEERKGDLAQ